MKHEYTSMKKVPYWDQVMKLHEDIACAFELTFDY